MNLKTIFYPLILLFAVSNVFGQNNFRIFPSPVTQTEPVIAVNPLNPMIMFASAVTINTANGFRSEGVYVSTNGGLNWSGSDSCKGANISNHGGDPGIMIDKNGVFILNHIGSIFYGVYSHYSTDMGSTWSAAYILTNQQPEDKGTSITDNNPSSSFYGRSYASWVNFVSPFPVLISYTTNSGANWTSPAPINNPPPQRCSGGDMETGPNGEIYNTWSGVTSTLPFTEDYAGFGVSANGGVNWTVQQNIFDMNGINGTLPSKGNIRVNGLPRIDVDLSAGPRRGWIYIITTEKNIAPAGTDPDIIFHRSTNGGSSWSQGIRVNQDALNNGKIQYFPAVRVDSAGNIFVLYYDDRNTASDSAEVYLSRSTDGGNTWNDFVVSDNRFKPKSIIGGPSSYQGDFISLTSVGNKLHAFWMADYSGLYQIWSSILNINTIGIKQTGSVIPKDFSLEQNYPNPFNPVTRIRFNLPIPSEGGEYTPLAFGEGLGVRLIIYDLLGKQISELINGELKPGSYEVDFNGSNLPSGVYFYTLKTNEFSKTKKMILLK
jgi:hypothetical protein